MIAIYINLNQPQKQYNDKLNEILDSIQIYHFGDTVVLTDKSLQVVRDMVTFYKPYQFIVYSVHEFDSSPTMVSELILHMVGKLGITFTSLSEKLYFYSSDILEIYPKVFEQFQQPKES